MVWVSYCLSLVTGLVYDEHLDGSVVGAEPRWPVRLEPKMPHNKAHHATVTFAYVHPFMALTSQ
eukprot:3796375-Amphidinium_carterae.1